MKGKMAKVLRQLNSSEAINVDFRFKGEKQNAKIFEDLENSATYVLINVSDLFITGLHSSERLMELIRERISENGNRENKQDESPDGH